MFTPGYLITSLSKSVAPGLRVGYLAVPEGERARFEDVLWTTTIMASPLTAEIASRWIIDGTAETLAWERREECRAWQAIARRALGGFDFDAHESSYHLWLRLPEPWRADAFVARALERGVRIVQGDRFAVGRTAPAAVRVSLGPAPTRSELERGLNILAEMLGGASAAPPPIV